MPLPKTISVASKSAIQKSKITLERWSRALDVFYIKDFGILLKPLNELNIDVSKVEKAWHAEDWHALTELQIELLTDWPDDLRESIVNIPRCAVYFLAAIDRKRGSMDRSRFGDCDRHIANLSMYELVFSCAYRQMSRYDLWKDDSLVQKLMALHQPWFKWQTDVQRMIIWTRRKEYENVIAYRPFLLWKIDRLECDKCKTRYNRLISRMRQQYQVVSAHGKPFNGSNYFGKLEDQPEYEEIMYLRKIRG